MRKIFLALSVVVLCYVLCFAQDDSGSTNEYSGITFGSYAMTGTVDHVKPENRGKGLRAELYIINDKGNRVRFLIDYRIPITDKKGKQITYRQINPADKIKIGYIVNSIGVNIAKSISFMKDKEEDSLVPSELSE